jgi:diguanylate cyclase (GGDEF)-like protein
MRALVGRFSSFLANEYLVISKFFLVLGVAALSTTAYRGGMLDSFENVTLDQRFKLRSQQFTHPKIILIEVAEDSIQAIGRWPWTRDWHAALVKALADFGARAVAFDVLFSEPSQPEHDLAFSQAMARAGNVYLPIAFNETEGETGYGIVQPIPVLANTVKGTGHITISPDPDGLLRRIRLRLGADDGPHLQLGFKMALDLYGVREADVVYHSDYLEIPIPQNPVLRIPLTDKGEFLLNWAGRWKESFLHLSFIDVIVSYSQVLKGQKPRIPKEIFQDAICIVGVTATGLFDIRSIPLEPAYPAVGVNATVLNSILERKFLRVLHEKTNLGILWVLAFLIFGITLRFNYLKSAALIAAVAVAYVVAALVLFMYESVVLCVVYPLFLVFTSFTALSTYHQVVITIEKRRLLKLATKDSMTGLFNIGHFKLLLAAELNSIRLRRNKDLSIIMADVDFFKKINDTYGHASGDEVLRALAEILREGSRSLDVACRYGGEEFILMLPGASIENAEKVAEKIRRAVEERKFLLGDQKKEHPVTASFGVATYRPGEPPDDFIKRADKALYEAKESGRNRVCRAP